MTTNDILPLRDIKHYCIHCQYTREIVELKDQINCIQKSFANLRKDLYVLRLETSRNVDRRFWIHGKALDKVNK